MFRQINNQFQMMSRLQRRIFWIILAVIAGAGCYLALYAFGAINFDFLFRIRSSDKTLQKEQIEKGQEMARSAFDIALPHARQWQEDAVLSSLGSLEKQMTDSTDRWKLIFTSPHKKGKGFLIEVNVSDQSISSTQEIPYTGFSAEFPADIISEQEAIQRVHQIKGYEHELILGIEAVYGPAEKAWYWGVRTSKGVVTVEAKKK